MFRLGVFHPEPDAARTKANINLVTPRTDSQSPSVQTDSGSRPDSDETPVLVWWFVLLLLVGLVCRFVGLRWDESNLLHPDERFLSDLVTQLGWPTGWGSWFNSRLAPLNPENLPDTHYVYGQLPLALGKLAASLGGITDSFRFLVVGRALSALCGAVSVGLTYWIGRGFLSRRGAVAAAALVAGSALDVQSSHFFTVDNFAANACLWSLLAGAAWYAALDKAKSSRAALLGLTLGVALACKLSAVFAFAGAFAFFAIAWPRLSLRTLWLSPLIVLLTGILTFRVLQPMAFLGAAWGGLPDLRPDPRFWADVGTQSAITNGRMDIPFDIQWIGRAAWLYPGWNLLRWGWGPMFGASALCGLALVLRHWRERGRVAPQLSAATVFAIVLFVVEGAAFSKFTRYYLPLTPCAAWLAVYFWDTVTWPARLRHFGLLLTVTLTTLWAVAVTSIYTRRHTRLVATSWIRALLPHGEVVANESAWDEALPLGWVPSDNGAPTSGEVLNLDLALYEPDTAIKRERILTYLSGAHWIFLSSPRVWRSVPRWPERYPLTTAYYHALFSGQLGFKLEKEFTSYPQLGPLVFPDDGVEEALTVYDHPRVLLFRKTSAWSLSRASALLDAVPLPAPQNWIPNQAPAPDSATLPVPPPQGDSPASP